MRRGYSTPLVIAIMAFAVVAFLFLIDTAMNPDGTNKAVKNTNVTVNTNKSSDQETTLEYVIPIDDWKTFSDTSTGVTIRYPQNWYSKSCGDAMQVYFAPNDFECGAGLNAIGIQRTSTDQTVASTIAARKAQLTQTTILDVTVAGYNAKRIIGFEAETATGRESTRQNDDVYFRQGEYLWSITSTLQDDGRIFLRMIETLSLAKSATSDPTAGWKTYTNTKYGYSMKYPTTWVIQEVNSSSLDGTPLVFTQFSDGTDQNGALVVAYKNSPPMFQDGEWDATTDSVTTVGGRKVTSTLFSPDMS